MWSYRILLLLVVMPGSIHAAAGRSLVFDGVQTCAVIEAPSKPPFLSIAELRYEFRLHDFRTGFSLIQRLLHAVGGQIIRIEPESSILRWYSFTDNGNAVQANLEGRRDVILRLQRSIARNLMILEMWNGDGSGYVSDQIALLNKVPVKQDGDLQLGGICDAAPGGRDALRGNLAFFRWFSTVIAPNSTLPMETDRGDLGDWNFDDNLNSAGNYRTRTSVSSYQYAATPTYPPVAFATPPNSAVAAGKPISLDGWKSVSTSRRITSYEWTQLSGPVTLAIVNPRSAFTQANGTVPGEYAFRLVVKDDMEVAASTTFQLAVLRLDAKERVQMEDQQAAFVTGPMLASKSVNNPWPWFDQTLIDFGNKLGALFPAFPPGESPGAGTVSIAKGTANVTGNGTRFTAEFKNIPPADRYIVIRCPLSAGGAGRHTLPVLSVIDDQHLTLKPSAPWDLASVTGAQFGVTSSTEYYAYENRNYYDQALVQYMNYYRTGQAKYRDYARKIADSRWLYSGTDEGRAAPDMYAPRSVGLAGMVLRALDGRPEFWPFIEKYVRYHWDIWLGMRRNNDVLWYGTRDGGYMLLFGAYMAQLHPNEAVRSEFRVKIEDIAVNYFARLQYPDGSWRWADPDFWKGMGEQPFHVGLLLEGMIATYQITRNPVVLKSILRSCDHLMSIYLPAPIRGHWYFIYDNACPTGCEASGATEDSIRDVRARNNTIIHAFGFAWVVTGLEKYRRHGDELFASTFGRGQGPGADALAGRADTDEKQYGQSFRTSGRYLAWRLTDRQPPDTAAADPAASK